jgi:predicted protein tyrosine phosphatase
MKELMFKILHYELMQMDSVENSKKFDELEALSILIEEYEAEHHIISQRPNILIVCGKNKRRSRTAEFMFKNDQRLNIRSAGLSPKSDRKISENDLKWANVVLVMETDHRAKIKEIYRHLELPKIEVLNIPDEYEYLDEELMQILDDKVNESVMRLYNI